MPGSRPRFRLTKYPRLILLFLPVALLIAPQWTTAAGARTAGILTGTVVDDTGAPVPYANVAVIPADTLQKKTGTLTLEDGTFRLGVAAGVYTIVVQAISYTGAERRGVIVEESGETTLEIVLRAEALEQEEIVVEGEILTSGEAGLLKRREKSGVVSDGVSSEEISRTPDSDAAEVLKRVTGVSVQDERLVFVRGLGERYSSTEVDGVRMVSTEENKRVVGMDLFPASLLENVTVQKTYTADRPGEFGGGDVQLRTIGFPISTVFMVELKGGLTSGASFNPVGSYDSNGTGILGFGAGDRELPDLVKEIAGDRPIKQRGLFDPSKGFTPDTLALLGQSFNNVWLPQETKAGPNGGINQSFGGSFKVLNRKLGITQGFTYGNTFDTEEATRRAYTSVNDTLFDYQVNRSVQTLKWGGVGALSYQAVARHVLFLRGFLSNTTQDEVRLFEGFDSNVQHNQIGTRLMFLRRSVASLSLAGEHGLALLGGANASWMLSRSWGRREQPDRRETLYEEKNPETEPGVYEMGGRGAANRREWGDQQDDGYGLDIDLKRPLSRDGVTRGDVAIGFAYQRRDRESFYRRIVFIPPSRADLSTPAESLFAEGNFGREFGGARIDEFTRDDDNYTARQKVIAGYINFNIPISNQVRGVVGVRVERGEQRVQSYNLFDPSMIAANASLDNTDVLPALNLTWSFARGTNLRFAASRTLSRPDLRELSPATQIDFVGAWRVGGNPDLQRATIDNYDIRLETFPGLGDVLAAGVFYKRLQDPIERVIVGSDTPLLTPENSESGYVAGVELEARSALGVLSSSLRNIHLTSNLTLVESEVKVRERSTVLGSLTHPLQGQASFLLNFGLGFQAPTNNLDVSFLVRSQGRTLENLGKAPRPDIYQPPVTWLDAAMNWRFFPNTRLKLTAQNLLDTEVTTEQGDFLVSQSRSGRKIGATVGYAFF
jgi:outer membrane receptor protein involved in Fe transport